MNVIEAIRKTTESIRDWAKRKFIASPVSAKVGQALVVQGVDEKGVPTSWESKDFPEGSVKTVNGVEPDENGNVEVETGGVKTVNDTEPDESGNVQIDLPNTIIDVTALPETDIDEKALYRLVTGTFVESGAEIEGWTCYFVDGLPEVGEPVTTDMSTMLFYYNTQDGAVFGYINEDLATQAGVSVGWYDIGMLLQLIGNSYGGVITDIADDPSDGVLRLLLSYDFYVFKYEWTKLVFAYEKTPKFDIRWDGNMDGKFTIDASLFGEPAGTYFVKVSDMTLDSPETQVLGGVLEVNTGGIAKITSDYVNAIPGATVIADAVIIVHSFAELEAAIGVPSGSFENGTYFALDTGAYQYVSRFCEPARIKKLDEKFLPELAAVAKTGNYSDLNGAPTVHPDVVRYDAKQYLTNAQMEMARNNVGAAGTADIISPRVLFGLLAGKVYAKAFHTSYIPEISTNLIVTVGSSAFYNCKALASVNLPAATSIGNSAFYNCLVLTSVNLPAATMIDTMAFDYCTSLASVNLPAATSIGSSAFSNCKALASVNLPAATMIGARAFYNCLVLTTLIIRSDADVCTLLGTDAFTGTPIANGTGYIYVPSSLIEQYKTAENWSTYAAQFRALEDYTVDGTTTGELDPEKTGVS